MRRGNVRYKNWKHEGFPQWLQDRMRDRGWNASDLARELDVVPSLVSRWMTERQQPSLESLKAIAQALHLSEHEVFMAAGHLQPLETDDDPRKQELIRKIMELELTEERYAVINNVLLSYSEARSLPSGSNA
jgi:transcriptional regulator with XRE-family HTH domain